MWPELLPFFRPDLQPLFTSATRKRPKLGRTDVQLNIASILRGER